MIKIAFCDDDLSVLKELSILMDRYRVERNQDITYAAFHSPLELLAEVERGTELDIIFLDVLMPGQNGISTAKEIMKYDTMVKIIYLTSSAEYAVDSYSVGAYFYQLKPIWQESFYRLMDSVLSECRRNEEKSLILRSKSGITRMDLDKLQYCEVMGRTLLFHSAVAGMSIVSRIFQFVLSVAIGVGQGLQPVAAFNYGARRFARVRKAAIFTISTAFVFMAVLNSLCWFNAEPLIRLFRDDPEVTAVAQPALRYQCVAMFLQPVIIVTNMMFQSIGKSGRATFLACCRQGVCFIPLILTLPRIWGLSGIELCQPIADGLTFCISVPFLLPFLKELKEQGDEE